MITPTPHTPRSRRPIYAPGLLVALTAVLLAAVLLAAGRAAGEEPGTAYQLYLPSIARPLDAVALEPFAVGLEQPAAIANAGDGRLFVAERGGKVRIIYANGFLEPQPFLDLSAQVETGFWEQGLLGLAFHPDYAANGQFYVFYSDATTTDAWAPSRLSRFLVDPANPNRALPDSETILLTVPQPEANHQAGDLHFGPDGYLYVAVGDGGKEANGQDRSTILGGILRLDVDHGGPEPYAIPADNPFVNDPTAAPELWLTGLRNPWRIGFNAAGDLFIGDVGSDAWEEINIQRAGTTAGTNFGWSCREGYLPRKSTGECREEEVMVEPAFVYAHDRGRCSIIGGTTYEGQRYPAMRGVYLFADLCEGTMWGMATADQTVPVREFGRFPDLTPSAFGRDANGELYVAAHFPGAIYRVVPGQ